VARITQFAGASAVVAAVFVHVYFNMWHKAYYYPGADETGFAATFVAILLGGLGLIGLIGATIVLRRQVSPAFSSSEFTPHLQNVPGPFYVVNGCCTACGVPEATAPEHFAYDTGRHCYVTRQPENPDELERMLHVIRGQELGCIRYRGTDPQIRRRLGDADAADQCDARLPRGVAPVLRNHVSFAAMDPAARTRRSVHVLEDFAEYLRGCPHTYRMTPIVQDGDGAHFSICWFEDNFHRVLVRSIRPDTGRWLVWHSFEVGLSETIDDWLKESERFGDVRWYSEAQWNAGHSGQERPW
jgi:4Fe-4S single cluster domain of Ferredoxin I